MLLQYNEWFHPIEWDTAFFTRAGRNSIRLPTYAIDGTPIALSGRAVPSCLIPAKRILRVQLQRPPALIVARCVFGRLQRYAGVAIVVQEFELETVFQAP